MWIFVVVGIGIIWQRRLRDMCLFVFVDHKGRTYGKGEWKYPYYKFRGRFVIKEVFNQGLGTFTFIRVQGDTICKMDMERMMWVVKEECNSMWRYRIKGWGNDLRRGLLVVRHLRGFGVMYVSSEMYVSTEMFVMYIITELFIGVFPLLKLSCVLFTVLLKGSR